MSEWKDIDNVKPEIGEHVLIYKEYSRTLDSFEEVVYSDYNGLELMFHSLDYGYAYPLIKFWMKLPEIPKGKSGKDLYNEILKILNEYLGEGKGSYKVEVIITTMSSILGQFIQDTISEEDQVERLDDAINLIKATVFNPKEYNEGKK